MQHKHLTFPNWGETWAKELSSSRIETGHLSFRHLVGILLTPYMEKGRVVEIDSTRFFPRGFSHTRRANPLLGVGDSIEWKGEGVWLRPPTHNFH
jgi:hypothetical protein